MITRIQKEQYGYYIIQIQPLLEKFENFIELNSKTVASKKRSTKQKNIFVASFSF